MYLEYNLYLITNFISFHQLIKYSLFVRQMQVFIIGNIIYCLNVPSYLERYQGIFEILVDMRLIYCL